jgi:hypothetical protein
MTVSAVVMIALSYFSSGKLLEFDLDNYDDSILANFVVNADETAAQAESEDNTAVNPFMFSNGYIELNDGVTVGKDLCNSFVLLPGVMLMNHGFLAVVYLIALVYLFLGIAIISDIFMESIEQITA